MLTVAMMLLGAFATALPAFAGGEGSKVISAKALSDHECDSLEWHFVITQVESEELAPDSISVTFSKAGAVIVELDDFTGKVAHYTVSDYLDETVISATTTIYGSWKGQFNLSHGPCKTSTTKPEDTTTSEPEKCVDYGDAAVIRRTASVEGGTASFTVKEDSCLVKISFSSYDLPNGYIRPFEEQVLYDNITETYGPGDHTVMIQLPDCNWQTDLYYGPLQPYAPHERLIRWDAQQGKVCEEPIETSVTVGGECLVREDKGVGKLSYTVNEGATLTIDGVGTFTESGSVMVDVDKTYTWSASADEGYVLIGKTKGEVFVEDCTPQSTTTSTAPPPTNPPKNPPTTPPPAVKDVWVCNDAGQIVPVQPDKVKPDQVSFPSREVAVAPENLPENCKEVVTPPPTNPPPAPTITVIEPVTVDTLPFTGSEDEGIIPFALGLLGAGGALLLATTLGGRKEETLEGESIGSWSNH
jgi:hypothetical protein